MWFGWTVYESPNDDMGYDISDYRAIMKQFGSMEDFWSVAGRHAQQGNQVYHGPGGQSYQRWTRLVLGKQEIKGQSLPNY